MSTTGATQGAERVSVYIDGFNLYFGLNDKGWRRYLWLDIPALATHLLKPHQSLVGVKYFTTRVGAPAESVRRQTVFLDALGVRGGVEIVYGNFIYNNDGCDGCGRTWTRREEKQTDVNLAVHMMRDAHDDIFDTALLISGDSDLVPAVKEVRRIPPGRRVVAIWPPERRSTDLCNASSASMALGRGALVACQLPAIVSDPSGYALCQPANGGSPRGRPTSEPGHTVEEWRSGTGEWDSWWPCVLWRGPSGLGWTGA